MAEPDVAETLLAVAEQDLRACEALMPLPDIGDAIVGFHAQQCVEKSIKAVLARAGVAFRRTHDIAELLDAVADHGSGRCSLRHCVGRGRTSVRRARLCALMFRVLFATVGGSHQPVVTAIRESGADYVVFS